MCHKMEAFCMAAPKALGTCRAGSDISDQTLDYRSLRRAQKSVITKSLYSKRVHRNLT
jgi:hypothetical protein